MKKCKENGFSLIELLVAIAIGFLAMAAMYTVFNSQHQMSVQNEDRMEMYGNINTSLGLLIKDTRMAGYLVPLEGAVNPINNFMAAGGSDAADFQGASQLKTPLTTGTEAIKTGSDAVMVLYKDNTCDDSNYVDTLKIFVNGNGSDAGICQPNCFSTGVYQVGQIALVSGTLGSIFVQIDSINNAATGGVACPGANYTSVNYSGIDELNLSTRNATAPGNPEIIGLSATLVGLETAFVYYVDTKDRLMRLPLGISFLPATITEGVEDMQIQYDLSTACTVAYWGACTAANAPAVLPSPITAMSEIRGVRFALVLRTLREDRTTYLNHGHRIFLFDAPVASTTDSYRRRTISELVRVKNLELQDL